MQESTIDGASRTRAKSSKKVFTDRAVQTLRPSRRIYWDAAQVGLGLLVYDEAKRVFVAVGRQAGTGKQVWRRMGRYGQHPPCVTLAEARRKAQQFLRQLGEGQNPREIEKERKRQEAQVQGNTVQVALEAFLKEQESRGLRRFKELAQGLRRELLGKQIKLMRDPKDGWKWITSMVDGPNPIWRDRPITEIIKRDVIKLLDETKAKRGKHAARHLLSGLKRFFNWLADGERCGIVTSPCERVRDRTIGISGRDLKRQRVLDDAEIRDVWAAAEAVGYPFGPVVQLLMLTGQRLGDVLCARRGEVDLDAKMLTIPPERFKTGVAHEVPLSPLAVELIRKLPKFAGNFLFTTTAGARPFSGVNKMKELLDKRINEARSREGHEPIPHWTIHDVRRSIRTRLVSDCGIDAYTAERVLGHALPGLHAVYDRGSHRPQKRAALDKWAEALTRILDPTPKAPASVVSLEEQRRKARGQ